jgi:hypothetical protein
MNKYFIFENDEIKLNIPELLLVKEFERLMDNDFNKCEEDPTGENHLIAYRLFKYLYLIDDIESPYKECSEEERLEYALDDSKLTIQSLAHPIISEAIKKYFIITNTRLSKLLKAAEKSIDKLTLYFETVDFTKIDDITGKPIFSAKDGVNNIGSLDKVVDGLKKLQSRVDEERKADVVIRGGMEKGIFD